MAEKKGISANVLKTRRDAAIRSLTERKPFIEGSLVKIRVTCGNPNCRCATAGEKHISHILTKKIKRKTKSVYVPVDMVEDVTEWTAEFRKIKKKLKEISALGEQIIKQHAAAKRAVSKNLKVLNQSPQIC